AVAHDCEASSRLAVDGEQRVEQGLEHDLGVHDVEREPGEPGPVAHPAQPVVLGAQRPVAGEEPGNEEHGPAQAGRNVLAPKDGVADEAEELEVEAALQPHRWDGIPAPQAPDLRQSGVPPARGWFGDGGHFVGLSAYSVRDAAAALAILYARHRLRASRSRSGARSGSP